MEVTVVDERTALENQVLGTYGELDKEVMLLASVRSVDQSGKLIKVPKVAPGKKKVIRAMQRTSFNKDDIDLYKASGILGENNKGGISILDRERVPPEKKDFLGNLVAEENEDREIIMERVIEVNENMSAEDISKVRKIFASLNRDRARTGDMIQKGDGAWVKKK